MKQTEKIINIVASVFIVLGLCVMPLFLIDGYYDLVEGKLYYIYFITGLELVAALAGFAFIGKRLAVYIGEGFKFLMIDKLIIFLFLANSVSFALSIDKQQAFLGAYDWYIGWMFVVTTVVGYFFIRLFGRGIIWNLVIVCGLIATTYLSMTGVLDRFSFYMIQMEERRPEFISVVGNIDWLCTILSLIFPITMCLFIFLCGYRWILAWIASITLSALCVTQGADSVVIIITISMLLLLYYCIGNRLYMAKWCLFAGQFLVIDYIMSYLSYMTYGTYYNYHLEHIFYIIGHNMCTLLIGVVLLLSGVILWAVYEKSRQDSDHGSSYLAKDITEHRELRVKQCRLMLALTVALLVVAYIVLFVINMIYPISVLSDIPYMNWGDNWGNGRGITIKSAMMMLKECNIVRILFGVGQECYYLRICELNDVLQFVEAHFYEMLTNAHCVPLTNMVHTGIIGTLAYYLVFVYAIISNRNKAIVVVPLVSYVMHGLISFDNVFNFYMVIVYIAICMSLQKRNNNERD